MPLSYQEIINLAAETMKYALPIGVVFCLAEKIVNLFLSLAFGHEKVKF